MLQLLYTFPKWSDFVFWNLGTGITSTRIHSMYVCKRVIYSIFATLLVDNAIIYTFYLLLITVFPWQVLVIIHIYRYNSEYKLIRCENHKSSQWRWSVKEGSYKNFAKFTGKHLYWSLFLIKLQTFRSTTLLKRDSNTGVFLWNLQNFKNKYVTEKTIYFFHKIMSS